MIVRPERKLWVPSRSVGMSRPWFKQRGFIVLPTLFRSRKVGAIAFDGANDVITKGGALTVSSPSPTLLFSAWIRIDGGDGTNRRFFNGLNAVNGAVSSTSGFRISLNTSNQIIVLATPTGGSGTAHLATSASAYTASGAWIHILYSLDLTPTDATFLYVNDADDLGILFPTGDGGGTEAWDVPDWAIGGASDIDPLTSLWNGAMAELYVAVGQNIDITVEANRRKFITSDGKPAPLGADGSKPTGTAPTIYCRLRKNESVANFAVNRGTGGDFSIIGSPTYASSSPSD